MTPNHTIDVQAQRTVTTPVTVRTNDIDAKLASLVEAIRTATWDSVHPEDVEDPIALSEAVFKGVLDHVVWSLKGANLMVPQPDVPMGASGIGWSD